MDTQQRPAVPGELCTCGRQTVTVYSNERFGDAGHCGIEGAASNPVLPCPWCGTREAHKASWGDPTKCPSYQLRAPVGDKTMRAGSPGRCLLDNSPD